MAVQALARGAGQDDFVQHGGISGQQAGIVHHFPQGADPFVPHERSQIRGGQDRAGILKGRAGHAGGQRQTQIQGQVPRAFQQITQAGQTQNIGDFMWIGHHCGRAVRHDQTGEFRRGQHGGFQVQMGVYQAGQHETPARVHAAAGRKPAWAETQKNPVARGYGNVAQQGAAEHIHHIHVFHAEIGRFQASGHADAPGQGFACAGGRRHGRFLNHGFCPWSAAGRRPAPGRCRASRRG